MDAYPDSNGAVAHQRRLYRFEAFLLFVVATALGVGVGIYLYHHTATTWSLFEIAIPIKLIVGSLGAGVLLMFSKDIWALFLFIAKVDGKDPNALLIILGESGKLLVTVISIVYGIATLREITAPPPDSVRSAQLLPLIFVDQHQTGTSNEGLLAIFPLTFEHNAKQDDDASGLLGGWGTGVRVRIGTEQLTNGKAAGNSSVGVEDFTPPIDVLLRAMAPCGAHFNDSTGSVPHKVVLRVRGFASSREFKHATGVIESTSNERNLAVANQRARAITLALIESAKLLGVDNDFDIHDQPWPSYENGGFAQMTSVRPYIDRVQSLSEEPERLNRRAEILILDAGQCNVGATPTQ